MGVEQIVIPNKKDQILAKKLQKFLANSSEENGILDIGNLISPEEKKLKLRVTSNMKGLLNTVLNSISDRNPIKIVKLSKNLTTQEAANILNVSRTFLITEMKKGNIEFQMKENNRELLFEEVMRYKRLMKQKSYDRMNSLAGMFEELDIDQ